MSDLNQLPRETELESPTELSERILLEAQKVAGRLRGLRMQDIIVLTGFSAYRKLIASGNMHFDDRRMRMSLFGLQVYDSSSLEEDEVILTSKIMRLS